MPGNPVAVAQRAQLRAELKQAIRDACRSRKDSRAHYEAALEETMAEPADTWPWWLEYWRGQYRSVRVHVS